MRTTNIEAIQRFPLGSYIGKQAGPLLDPNRLHTLGHANSESALRLLADGQLVIEPVPVSAWDITRVVYMVTGPSDLNLKLSALSQRFEDLVNEWNPDGTDFPHVFAPGKHPLWRAGRKIHEQYWFALFDGIILTFDMPVARQVRQAYMQLCAKYHPHLYAKANHCPTCQSSRLKGDYDPGDYPGHDLLTLTCQDCRAVTTS
jgi:hypothetical protein